MKILVVLKATVKVASFIVLVQTVRLLAVVNKKEFHNTFGC